MNHEPCSLATITSEKIIKTLPIEVIDFLSERALKSRTVYVVVAYSDWDYSFWSAGITFEKKDVKSIVVKDILREYLGGQELDFDPPLDKKYQKYIVDGAFVFEKMDFEISKQLVKDISELEFIKITNTGLLPEYKCGSTKYKINKETFYKPPKNEKPSAESKIISTCNNKDV